AERGSDRAGRPWVHDPVRGSDDGCRGVVCPPQAGRSKHRHHPGRLGHRGVHPRPDAGRVLAWNLHPQPWLRRGQCGGRGRGFGGDR
ncbi:hypothetical protein ABTL53_19600, partial [Acinetobacter baumannii]